LGAGRARRAPSPRVDMARAPPPTQTPPPPPHPTPHPIATDAGGRAVIDGIEQNLGLERWRTAPSRATLYHWGNTSSSSVWYELRYCEGERGYLDGKGSAPVAAEEDAEWAGGDSGASTSAAGSGTTAGGSGGAPPTSRRASQRRAASAAPPPPAAPPADAAAAAAAAAGGAGGAARASDRSDPDAEAKAAGWDAERKWHLPDYEGRHVRPGDRVVQFAFGAGFKCNSALLPASRAPRLFVAPCRPLTNSPIAQSSTFTGAVLLRLR
jgi:hypothetical protein